jgi:hypothetical protein
MKMLDMRGWRCGNGLRPHERRLFLHTRSLFDPCTCALYAMCMRSVPGDTRRTLHVIVLAPRR